MGRAEPARVPAEAGTPSLFGLAPCGVCPARRITAAAVRPYRTFSPLPRPCGTRRYVFCGTFRRVIPELAKNARTGRPPGRYPAHCSAEFGLSSPTARRGGSDRPVRLPTYLLYSMPVGVIGSRWQVHRDSPPIAGRDELLLKQPRKGGCIVPAKLMLRLAAGLASCHLSPHEPHRSHSYFAAILVGE